MSVMVAAAAFVLSLASVNAPSEPEALIVEAEAALGKQHWAEAGDAFRRAYGRMPKSERSGDLGEHVVTEAVAAYDEAYREDGDARHLIHAQDLLRAAAEDRGGRLPTSELRAELDRVTALLERLDDGATDPEPEPEPPPPVPPVDDATPSDTAPRERSKPDGAGIALVALGAVLIGGGVGLIANGATVPARARRRVDERGGEGPGDADYLAKADRLRTGFIAGGAVSIALGVGGLVWGAVRLKRGRSARARLFPTAGGFAIRY